MAEMLHPEAMAHAPYFIAAPHETDQMMVVMACMLIAVVVTIGVLYFKLHALPERMAHGANSSQMQLVGVMTLLALFTHNNAFWVLALLLAAFKIPDFNGPMRDIADAIRGRPRVVPEDDPFAETHPPRAHPATHPDAPAAASTASVPARGPAMTDQERGNA